MAQKRTRKSAHGPKPDRLQIEGDWTDAVNKAIKKKRPEEGWPEVGKEKESPKKKGD